MNDVFKITFFGSNTMGEKGQVVVPVEGRRALDLSPGDKLIFLGQLEKGVMIVAKTEIIEQHMAGLKADIQAMHDRIESKAER